MKVLHAVPGISPLAGGPTRSVTGLVRALRIAGVDVTLCVLRGDDEFKDSHGATILMGRSALSKELIKSYDLVHLHGLWDLDIHAVAVLCREAKVPYVMSPRGMLDPWALSVKKWKKRVGMLLFQRRDLTSAAAFHATAELEASHIRAQGLKQPIIISPNGVDFPDGLLAARRCRGVKDAKVALFLSRLHPGKGLISLARAWAQVKPSGWVMRVIGPDSYGHKAEVMSELELLNIQSQWQFRDAVDDVEKWNEYSTADLLVHPSVSENFGITIAEGLAAGIPVICTKGTPWKDVAEKRCGWWIDQGIEPLSAALREATSLTCSDLEAMGRRGAALIRDEYSWTAAAKDMVSGYKEILGLTIAGMRRCNAAQNCVN